MKYRPKGMVNCHPKFFKAIKNSAFCVFFLLLNYALWAQSTPKFNDYVPQVPIDAYKDVLIYKQKIYDSRMQWVNDQIGYLKNLNYYYLSHNDPISYETMNDLMNEWAANTVHLDLLNEHIFKTVTGNLRFFENKIREEYNNAIESSRKENSLRERRDDSNEKGYKTEELRGVISVLSYSPILDKPDFKFGKCIWKASDNSVTIINRANKDYYYVRKGNITGYLWVGWIKK